MRISDWSSDVCSSDLMLRRTDVIWPYETEGVPALNGRRLSWPRGKVVGGSSSVNGTIFIRGLREEYDRWRQMGNIGWGYDDVLPFFKKFENFRSEEHTSELKSLMRISYAVFCLKK